MKKPIRTDKPFSERIESLVKLVEKDVNIKRYKRRLTAKRLVVGVIPTSVVIGIVIWLFFIVFQVASRYMTIAETENVVVLMVSVTALTITLISFIMKLTSELGILFKESSNEEVTNWYFKKLKQRVEKEDIPLLKALIMMKCKQPDIDLVSIHKLHDSMFTEKQLLERLYE